MKPALKIAGGLLLLLAGVFLVLTLLARSGGNGAVVTNRFEARVPVADATPATVAPALNQASNQVAEAVAAWIGG